MELWHPTGPFEIIMEIGAFVFGLCVGSFINVCIYRLPLSKSIVTPPSACPGCGTHIRFFDNIPLFSYLILRGKCRSCKTAISIRYPIVELLTGLFAWAVFMKFGPTFSGGHPFCFYRNSVGHHLYRYRPSDHPEPNHFAGHSHFCLLRFVYPGNFHCGLCCSGSWRVAAASGWWRGDIRY